MSDVISYRFWHRSKIQLVREQYPIGGAKNVAALLPHRTPIAIYECADKLGLHRPGWDAWGKEVDKFEAAEP